MLLPDSKLSGVSVSPVGWSPKSFHIIQDPEPFRLLLPSPHLISWARPQLSSWQSLTLSQPRRSLPLIPSGRSATRFPADDSPLPPLLLPPAPPPQLGAHNVSFDFSSHKPSSVLHSHTPSSCISFSQRTHPFIIIYIFFLSLELQKLLEAKMVSFISPYLTPSTDVWLVSGAMLIKGMFWWRKFHITGDLSTFRKFYLTLALPFFLFNIYIIHR